MAWTKTTDGKMYCDTCKVPPFPVGHACGCVASPSPSGSPQAQASQPNPGTEDGVLSSELDEPAPRRKRGGVVVGELLSTADVAMKTAEVARRARATYQRIAHATDVKRAKKLAEAGVPADIAAALADREITMRRTQLIALDIELKALRLAGVQAEAREGDQRVDRLERTARAVLGGGVKREEAVH